MPRCATRLPALGGIYAVGSLLGCAGGPILDLGGSDRTLAEYLESEMAAAGSFGSKSLARVGDLVNFEGAVVEGWTDVLAVEPADPVHG